MMPCNVRSSLAFAPLFALVAALALSACHSNQTQSVGCTSDQECITQHDGDDRWYCDSSQSPPACSEGERDCNTADDCCPSQVCNLQGHFCADQFTSCTGAGSCPVAGEVCETIGVRPTGLGCTFDKCSTTGTCADTSLACFNDYCVGAPPCNGGCAPLDGEDRVCVTATNYCSPSPKDASCQVTCPTGQMLVLHNPQNIFDTCDLASETCDCVALPPLVVTDVARHSSIAESGSSVYVSAYDGQYGDLVVHTFAKTNPATPTASIWVDGVPATGPLGGDPNGPRHGITAAGPNVGEYTSIAANPTTGDLYVSYYDVDNGDLKFAARYGGASATWATMTLDGSSAAATPVMTGDVGLYTSIALTSANLPAIAYFQRASVDTASNTETGNVTQLLYIVANKAQPLARTDWSTPIVIDTLTRNIPCGGSCGGTQICVADSAAPNGSRCGTPATCSPACSGTTTCVLGTDAAQTPVCDPSLQAQLQTDLPQGTGLMPSLKFMDDLPVIAYYDSINGALKAVIGASPASGSTIASPAFGTPVVIDGLDASPAPKRDTGRYPSVAIGAAGVAGGRIAISFQDLTSQQFLLYQASSLIPHALHDVGTTIHNIHLIDNGIPANGAAWHPQTFPGVQGSVAFTPSGQLAFSYQDGTLVDLQFVEWDPVNHVVEGTPAVVRGNDGSTAAGFYPHIVVDSTGTAYFSSASIKAVSSTQSANKLTVDTKATP